MPCLYEGGRPSAILLRARKSFYSGEALKIQAGRMLEKGW